MHKFKLSSNSLKRIEGVDPLLVTLIKKAILVTPIDFGIPKDGGIRTSEQQAGLFAKEVSKCDGVKIKSKHQSGKAFDFYAYIDGHTSWDPVHLAILYGVFNTLSKEMGLDLVWGGTFGSTIFHGWDGGHIEIA